MDKKVSAIAKKTLAWAMPPIVMAAYYKTRQYIQMKRASKELHNHSRLHLACGWNILKDWANVDTLNASGVIYWNLLYPLPVNDNSIEYIFCEHFIEHIATQMAQRYRSHPRQQI